MNRTTIAPPIRAACDSDMEEGVATTRKTIDYPRLGVAACEAFADGPAAFADFMRTTLSIAAKVHATRIGTRGNQPDPLDPLTAMSQRDTDIEPGLTSREVKLKPRTGASPGHRQPDAVLFAQSRKLSVGHRGRVGCARSTSDCRWNGGSAVRARRSSSAAHMAATLNPARGAARRIRKGDPRRYGGGA
jgi:hypothetical protein